MIKMLKPWTGKTAKGIALMSSMLALAAARLALAQPAAGGGSTPISLPNPLAAKDFTQVVANVASFLLTIAIPLTAVMALIGGFQMITAGGNPEKFSNGRKTLMYAVIGFAVVLLAGGVASIITSLINGS